MNGIATAPEFQAAANGGHTFQNTGTDTGMFLNANNEPEFRINNSPKAVVRNNPSLAASDNTLVTMAMLQEFKAGLFNVQFPVGISIITQDPRNPAEYLGFGSWERDLEGRALVGYSSDVTANTPDWKKGVNNIYGSDTHKLTVDEIPAHKHSTGVYNKFGSRASESGLGTITSEDSKVASEEYGVARVKDSDWQQAEEKSIGGGQPHNIVSQSKVKFIFTRIA